jgi:hypothetical protein
MRLIAENGDILVHLAAERHDDEQQGDRPQYPLCDDFGGRDMVEQLEVNGDEPPNEVCRDRKWQATWLRAVGTFSHQLRAANPKGLDDAAANPQAKGANSHDHKAEVTTAIAV